MLEKLDRRILTQIQSSFPVVSEPYKEIATRLHIDGKQIIADIKRLKKDKIIRRIGAIFDSRQLGYSSTLIAAKTDPAKEAQVAEFVNKFNEVTHNYGREDDYNLWFTLIAESEEKIAMILSKISALKAVQDIRNLPAKNLFKVRVEFDFEASSSCTVDSNIKDVAQFELLDKDTKLIRLLQENLPLTQKPFCTIAKKLGLSEAQVLKRVNDWLDVGVIRRLGAVVNHHQAGISANGMVVWQVPASKVKKTGETMACFKEVTHCYERPTFPGWKYNLYTMVHGKNRKACQEIANQISKKVHIKDYKVIFSNKQYKKTSMKYFA
ncbi:MAG: Lrp/AsnC family transcriptional regulator [Actinobacteria bacterium]|nr:MAG: Lrp/AsnC family transcriptional regulator [Actinomycetota bacterium]